MRSFRDLKVEHDHDGAGITLRFVEYNGEGRPAVQCGVMITKQEVVNNTAEEFFLMLKIKCEHAIEQIKGLRQEG